MVSIVYSMMLSVITLNYKTKEETLACVDSLYQLYTSECDKKEIEHIIVDNDSQDDSVPFLKKEIVKKKYPHVTLIANNENAGFGKGNNVGVKKSKGDYILFLNSDTKVVDRGFLDMVDFLKNHPKAAILGAKLRYPNGKQQLSAWKFYTLPNAFLMLLGLERFGFLTEKTDKTKQVDWVTGACMMVRKDIFEKIGMFDEKIFMYMEDMEICYRAKKAGYDTYYFPSTVVMHQAQGSSNRGFAIINIYKNLLYFYKKHRTPSEYAALKLLLQMKAHVLILYGRLAKKSGFIETYEKALAASR